MIERLVSLGVAVAEHFADTVPREEPLLPPEEPLFPQEEEVIARAGSKRRAEFRAVRGCARAALAGLGIDRPPLVPGRRGAPSWPPGVVGSMTHCTGYAAVAVARTPVPAGPGPSAASGPSAGSGLCDGLGIDAEPHAVLPEGVLSRVTVPVERDHLETLGRTHPGICWDRLLFSAKESVYKVWSPRTGTVLDLDRIRIVIHPDDGTFDATLPASPPDTPPGTPPPDGHPPAPLPRHLTGRWLVDRGLIVTAIAVVPSIHGAVGP